ncbi:MAG: FAD:protein FMN transferase [Actinomycetota bacterium]|nr:FAD:protein FMN transferase [Actinomycetota bacterium]
MSKAFFKKIEVAAIAGIFFVAILIFLSISSCKFRTIDKFEETREMMGTYVTITVYSDEETAANAINAAFEEIEKIENIASIYDEKSEASFLNKNGYIEDPSPEFLELIKISVDYYNITDGCFDITVQPLLDLWSAGLWKESEEVQAQKIKETLELVGSDKIDIKDNRIEFKKEGMAITFGGIAKGYAVDKAVEKIKEYGINCCLVNAGGDLYAMGIKPDGEKWAVELESPDEDTEESTEEPGTEPVTVFLVSDKAVTTSGGYHRYYDLEKKVHHINDPRTGYTADKCKSVTIIADNCTDADVLATSVFVMGPDDGIKLVESLNNVEAFIIDSGGKIYKSSGISEYIR